ncbi:MAG: hypothetical protein CVV30_04720 [Methanomicrobiales archaeon HGW-Methanomicrobiales-1]|nr:MAG: hypothetical protein CVV30_04720 [Methanomicrobiales archaeon HGW-Methanomicrobiales-1]
MSKTFRTSQQSFFFLLAGLVLFIVCQAIAGTLVAGRCTLTRLFLGLQENTMGLPPENSGSL